MRFKIDVDSHYLHPGVFDLVSEKNKHRVPKFTFSEEGKLLAVEYDVDPSPGSMNPLPPTAHNRFLGFCNIEERAKDFENLGIGFQVLNPQEHAMRFTTMVEKELAVDMAHSYNRTLLELVKKYPEKFTGCLLLVQQDPDWSLKEMEWGKENGFNAVICDVSWNDGEFLPGWPLVMSPKFEEICAKCVELDMLLNLHHSMHQIGFNHISVYRNLKLHNLYPSHHKTALISLITSKILDRHPTLQVLFSEGMMQFVGQSYRYLERNHDGDILKYFKNNFHFTIETEQTQEFEECVQLFGADRFLFATDYPHDDPGGEMKFHDHKIIENHTFLSEEDKDLICYKNAVRLFKLNHLKI